MKTLWPGLIIMAAGVAAQAQITLTGTAYTENFDGLGSGLPAGWSVYVSATTTTLGTAAGIQSAATDWSATLAAEPLNFRNIASDNIASNASSSTQSTDFDRALGWRPGNAASRNGALTLAINNTTGFQNFSLSIKLFSPNNVSTDQAYALEYRLGGSGGFAQIGSTYTTGTVFGSTTLTADSITLSALNNQSSSVYIRVRGTTAAGTSSSGLDVLGVDSFSLSFAPTAVPEPSAWAAVLGVVVITGVIIRRRKSATLP